jgi:hypothetical protein
VQCVYALCNKEREREGGTRDDVIEVEWFCSQAGPTLVVVPPLDDGKEHLPQEPDGLLEDQADGWANEDGDLGEDSDNDAPERRRYPDDGDDSYLDEASHRRIARYCTCSWDQFMAAHNSLDIECSVNDCLYWYHVDCTSLPKGMSKEQVEALENWCCEECSAKSNTK